MKKLTKNVRAIVERCKKLHVYHCEKKLKALFSVRSYIFNLIYCLFCNYTALHTMLCTLLINFFISRCIIFRKGRNKGDTTLDLKLSAREQFSPE